MDNFKLIYERAWSKESASVGKCEDAIVEDHLTYIQDNTFHTREIAQIVGVIFITKPFDGEKKTMVGYKEVAWIKRKVVVENKVSGRIMAKKEVETDRVFNFEEFWNDDKDKIEKVEKIEKIEKIEKTEKTEKTEKIEKKEPKKIEPVVEDEEEDIEMIYKRFKKIVPVEITKKIDG
jgi:hypothetical protein